MNSTLPRDVYWQFSAVVRLDYSGAGMHIARSMRARDGSSACHQADLAPHDESRDHEATQHQHPLGRLRAVRRDRESKLAAPRRRADVPRYQRMIAARSQALIQAEPGEEQRARTIVQPQCQVVDVRRTRTALEYVVIRVERDIERIQERARSERIARRCNSRR